VRRKTRQLTPRVAQRITLYRQVVQTLAREIRRGVHPVGARLPAENVLRDRFKVSRHTVREALRQLREAGLVSSRQGAGTTVRRSTATHPYVHEIASIDDLVTYVSGAQYRPARGKIVIANSAMAGRLGGSVGQRWLRLEGYRFAAGEAVPVCWTEVFVHANYAQVGALVGKRSDPIYRWIEDQYDERISEVEQVLRTRPMPASLAAKLKAKSHSTAVEVRRAFRIASGATVEVSFNLFPADRFTFSMRLRRAKA
jgi:GntR family transcriptional regulator